MRRLVCCCKTKGGSLKQALLPIPTSTLHSHPNLFSHLLGVKSITNDDRSSALCKTQQLHALIITSGAASDRFTSNHLLNTNSKLGHLPTASLLFSTMPRKNVMSSNILIGGLIRNGDICNARNMFDQMPVRNLASWNAMVTGFTHFGLNEQGLELFLEMGRQGFQPDEFSLASALRCCAGLKDFGSGRQIHSFVVRSGFEYDLCVGSSLAHMYMKCGWLREGEKALKGTPVLNLVSSSTMIVRDVSQFHHFRDGECSCGDYW